jgi:molybdopterin-guanine dinucleotide biosynthesis adapter protein
VVAVVGRSGAGKTSLLEALIPAIRGHGLKVATIKHHAHPGLDIDHPGKDTWRHARAGSDQVILAAPDRLASIRRLQAPLTPDELLAEVRDVDLVLAEGFRQSDWPKVEVLRRAVTPQPLCRPDELLALVCDQPVDLPVPRFAFGDVAALAEFLVRRLRPG